MVAGTAILKKCTNPVLTGVVFLCSLLAVQSLSAQPSPITESSGAVLSVDKGLHLQDKGNYGLSNSYLHVAARWYEDEGELNDAAHCYNHISSNYNLMSRLDSAETYARKALSLVSGSGADDPTEEIRSCTLLGLVSARRARYDAARRWLERARALSLHPAVGTAMQSTVIGSLGYLYDDLGEYDRAIALYREGLERISGRSRADKEQIAKLYNNLGYSYTNKGLYDRALEYYRKELETGLEIKGSDHPVVAGAYINIGSGYYRKGDWGEAMLYFRKSLDIVLRILGEDHNMAALNYDNIGLCNIRLGFYEEAISSLRKAAEIKKKIAGPGHPGVAETYKHLGSVYAEMNDYPAALGYVERALDIQRAGLGSSHPRLADTYNRLSEYYIEQGRHEVALGYIDRAREVITASSASRHPALAVAYTLRGRAQFRMGRTDAGLADIREALQILGDEFEPADLLSNPSLRSLSYPFYAVTTLYEKAKMLHRLGMEHGQQAAFPYLEASLSTCILLSQLLDLLQSEYINERSKLAITEKSHAVYEQALQVSYDLYRVTDDEYYLKEAFAFAEKSKARVLLEQLGRNNVQQYAGIPDSLVRYEQDLKYRTNQIRVEIDRTLSSDTSLTARLPALRDSLFRLKRQFGQHVEFLKNKYPRYHRLRYMNYVHPVAEIQSELSPDEAIVEYVVGEAGSFAFIITANRFRLHRLEKVEDLDTQIARFKETIFRKDKPGYHLSARNLYKILIEPFREDLADKSTLYIVPDKRLALLPFGALLSKEIPEAGSWRHLPYLVREFAIATLPSVTLAEMAKKRKRHSYDTELLAFAPVFAGQVMAKELSNRRTTERHNWPHLPFSLEEVEEITALFKERQNIWDSIWNSGRYRTFTMDRATERTFKRASGAGARYIHLATHAFVSDMASDSAGIAFHPASGGGDDGVLYAREIYNLSLDSELVVLSACETGGGSVIRGEGVMGLSRAFQYAGSRSLLASLWKIDDRSTSSLMLHFYRHLTEGTTKPESLRMAQLELIENIRFAHPYHWASFILIGM